jgi:ABC-type lipoprotein export system ATPase subunit
MTPLLRAQGLTLASFASGAGFDISILPGQRWLVTGASGAGKSTLMRTLLGLISPRSGTVYLDGVNLEDVTPKRLLSLRHSVGVVFSGGGLLPAWSGLQNLMLPLRASKGLEEEEAQAAVLEFADQCRIPGAWLERAATQLSAEQGTLLALARALLIQPKLLWVDSELVWGVLSHASTRLGAQLAEQVEQGCTLVVCAGATGLPREQVPPCPGPTHWARMQDGWLECRQPPTYWTLETADAQTPRA